MNIKGEVIKKTWSVAGAIVTLGPFQKKTIQGERLVEGGI